jgi:arsenate reductase
MSAGPVTIYGLKNCDSCKKALNALEASDRETAFVDIRDDADLDRLLPAWLKAVGAEKLVNRRSTTWRTLSNEEKSGALGPKAEAVLKSYPTLIKRPVIDTGAEILVGWDSGTQQALAR